MEGGGGTSPHQRRCGAPERLARAARSARDPRRAASLGRGWPVTGGLPALEPSAPLPHPASDQELTLEVARWLSAYRPPGPGPVRRATAEALVFGEMARAMRMQADLGRVELAA